MSQKVKGEAIGIDLGTTYSCAAVWLNRKNRVEVVPNEQGNKVTPSYVAFIDSEILVGEGAKNQIARNPTNTVFDVKRLIGSRFDDSQVTNDMESWPFKVMNGPSKKPTVLVKYKGEDKQYAPEELSAIVLEKMKRAAEEYIGKKVTDAVITVPAYFNNQQREATKEAGTIAGLNVLRLINEPTAAAIAYGVDNFADKQWGKDKNVLVFDLGGGTFDVSLLTISKTGDIKVKAVGGDTHLGGEDFDMALVNYCITVIMKKHTQVNLRGNPRAMARLKVACEKAKRDLSSTTFALIEIDCLYEGIDFSIQISRAKFEELNSTYFAKCVQLVEKCLFDGKTKKKDVNEVVLVGGSSRIPKVQQMLEEYFEGKTLYKTMNGDEAVAFGAAILASRLSGNDYNVVRDIILQDVTPLSLGIAAEINGVRDYMSVVIPRNTSIPTSKKKLFSIPPNAATLLFFSVYQGEGVQVKDNNLLGKFTLNILPPGPNRMPQLEVCFSLDINGILVVSAKELSTGHKNSVTISKF